MASVVVIALIIAALALARSRHVRFSPPIGSGCLVHARGFDVPLTSGQAGIASIIAGVAARRSLPVRAVTIAYAAALQESDLANLPYGDRDSVGVFQQRPSQGWGTRRELLDPVYATQRFFAALVAVPNYQHLLIYQAAQAVQHSADGQAYSQYAGQGAAMATGFSGQSPHDVWCWYGTGVSGPDRLAAASRQLNRAFGRLAVDHVGDPTARVHVRSQAAGWAVAAWLVTHASSYGIKHVSYLGYQWTAAAGQKGWIRLTGKHASSRPSSTHGSAGLGSAGLGSAGPGSTRHGSTGPGSTRHGSTRDGSTRHGGHDGTAHDGTVHDGTAHGTARHGDHGRARSDGGTVTFG